MKKIWISVFVLALALSFAGVSAAAPAEEWEQLPERRDFKIDNPENIYQQALKELQNNKPDFNAENSRHIVVSAHSDQYNADLVAVFIENRGAPDANTYDFVILGWPDIEVWDTGSAFIGGKNRIPSSKEKSGYVILPNPTLDTFISDRFDMYSDFAPWAQ